jgi:hypothetical protein
MTSLLIDNNAHISGNIIAPTSPLKKLSVDGEWKISEGKIIRKDIAEQNSSMEELLNFP